MAVQFTPDIAALRTLSGSSNKVVVVEGYYVPGDGGGGTFFYDSGDTSSSDNGATIIVAADGSRFHRIWDGGQFNVLWAGARSSGTTASDSAFAAAATVASYLYVPRGKYTLNQNFSYTIAAGFNAFTIAGDGAEQTVIYFPSNGGVTVNYDGTGASNSLVHIRDFSITAGLANAGHGIELVYNSTTNIIMGFSDISNVRIRGDDGIAAKYWNACIYVQGVSTVEFNDLDLTGSSNPANAGNGIVLQGNTIGSIVYNINACNLDFLTNAVTYGNYVQGLTVINTNMTNCIVGIVAYAGQTNLDQLTVIGCQIATSNQNVLALSSIGNVQLCNNLFGFSGTPTTGSIIQGIFSNLTCIGNNFDGSSTGGSQTAITITSGTTGVITGNTFIILKSGVVLQSGASYFNIQSNTYNNVTIPVSNSGTHNVIGGGSS